MKWIFKGFFVAVAITLFGFGLGWVTMKLWNWLMPMIFGLTMITFWQAVGLLVLSKILFSGFGRSGHRGRGYCGPGWKHLGHGNWRKRWEEKMASMSPEEKEKFMRGMNKCGWGAHWNPDCEEPSVKQESSRQQG
jgi:hypothetical protein